MKDWRRGYLKALAGSEVPRLRDVSHLLSLRMIGRFFDPNARTLFVGSDVHAREALLFSPKRPRDVTLATSYDAGPPDSYALLVAYDPERIGDLKSFRAAGTPGAHYLVRGPGWYAKDLERAGFRLDRSIGLGADPGVLREVLHPNVVRAAVRLEKVFGVDVISSVFGPLIPAADSAVALHVARDAKRSERTDLPIPRKTDPDRDPQVLATRGAIAAAQRRKEERERRIQGRGDAQDHRRLHEGKRPQGTSPAPQRKADRGIAARPRSGRPGIGAFIRASILAGGEAEATLAEVHRRWPESKASMSDWYWNKRKLKKEGELR